MLSDRKISLLLVVAILLATPLYLLYRTLQADEQQQAQQRFEQRARLSFNHAEQNLGALQEQLVALRNLMALKPELSRAQFDLFTSQLNMSAYGIAAFEWIPRVPRSERTQWTARARSEGVFDFRITDSGKTTQDLFPIYYTSSAQMNGLSLGIDLASKPAVLKALQLSAQHDHIHLGISENTQLDETEGAEVRLLLPVFGYAEDTGNVRSLRGYVSAMIRFEEAINIMLGPVLSSLNGLGLEIFDDNSGTAPLFSSTGRSLPQKLPQISFEQPLGDIRLRYRFIDISPPAPWWQPSRPTLMVLGITLSALVVLLLLQRSIRRRAQAEALAQQQGRSLQAVRNEYHNLFEKVIEGVYSATLDGRFMKVNPALARAFSYETPAEMLNNINHIGQQLHRDGNSYARFLDRLNAQHEVQNFEWEGLDKNGDPIWLSENAYLSHLEDGTPIYQGTIDVITERKLNEQQLNYQARHDSLTGLLNRTAFQQTLEECLHQRHGGAVLFVDIDGFKKINDSLGHGVGDQFLKELANRLRHSVRNEDLVARMGGDEFVIYTSTDAPKNCVTQLAERLQQQVSAPFMLSDQNQLLQVSASIGITFIGPEYQHADDVLRDADLAMYEVKNNGKADHQIFSTKLHERSQKQAQLETLLLSAMNRNEFRLYYQPVVNLTDGRVRGFEALLRWHSPELGLVSPTRFIPLAEQTTLIHDLGLWAVREAMNGLVRLKKAAGDNTLTLNINLSPSQLQHDELLKQLPLLLENTGLLAQDINFELTESALHSDEQQFIERLQAIRQLGFGIYIDDFGTGYSSLKRLVRFPVSGLKIDRSFVDRMDKDQNKQVMVEMIITMARLLQLNVVAEGIETEPERQLLMKQQCYAAQGFLFYKPLPERHLIEQLARAETDDTLGRLSWITV